MRALAITGMVTAFWISWIFFTGDMRATPPSRRMSEGTRSSAITEAAPASSAILACSSLVTSMMTPPLSISARPMCLRSASLSPFSSSMPLPPWDRTARSDNGHQLVVGTSWLRLPPARLDGVGQTLHTLVDAAAGDRREGQPHGPLSRPIQKERGARREGHAALECQRQQRGGLQPGGQREQQRESALRLGPGDVVRHPAPERGQQQRAPPSILRGHPADVTVEQPAFAEAVHG